MATAAGGRGKSMSIRRAPATNWAVVYAGDTHQELKALGKPEPLSVAPWKVTDIEVPPEKPVVTRQRSFIAGSSPMPMSRAPWLLDNTGRPLLMICRSMTLVE